MRTIIIFLICATMHGVANAATCEAGYYLENGECTQCNPNQEPFYCPGDDTRHPCPTTDTDYEKLSGWTMIDGQEARWAYTGATAIGKCYGRMIFKDLHGNHVWVERPFNGENYWSENNHWWFAAGTGYYLSEYDWTSSSDWYKGVTSCTNAPANAHYTGPGTPDAPDGSIIDANDCPWECNAGYGNHNGECQPLCTGGATKLHVGEHVFRLWRDRYTSPSLNVELSDGVVCYINLASGVARGTLNVSHRDQTYHVMN